MSESATTKAVEWVVLIILIIIGVALVPTVVDTVATGMTAISGQAVKISNYTTNSTVTVDNIIWSAVSFNMTQNCDLSNVTLAMYRVNQSAHQLTGNIDLDLEYADSVTGMPNGTVIVSSSILASTLTPSTNGANYTFTFVATHMYSGENYSLVVSAPNCNATEYVAWMCQSDVEYDSHYPSMLSGDSGVTWAEDGRKTFGFALYGVYNLVGISVASVLMGLIPFIFIVGLIIYFLVRLLRS